MKNGGLSDKIKHQIQNVSSAKEICPINLTENHVPHPKQKKQIFKFKINVPIPFLGLNNLKL